MTKMRWEDPPPTTGGAARRQRTIEELEQLKSHPGQWALVRRGAKSASSGGIWKAKGAEVRTSRNPDGTYRVYARWPLAQAGDEPRE